MYDYVCHLYLNLDICSLERARQALLPWEALLQTCSIIAEELSAYMASSSFTTKKQNRTLVLDTAMLRKGSATWRAIPCRLERAEYLIVNSTTASGVLLRYATREFLRSGCCSDGTELLCGLPLWVRWTYAHAMKILAPSCHVTCWSPLIQRRSVRSLSVRCCGWRDTV